MQMGTKNAVFLTKMRSNMLSLWSEAFSSYAVMLRPNMGLCASSLGLFSNNRKTTYLLPL